MAINSEKLLALEIVNSKIYTTESISAPLSIWRFKGKKIVFTNGCFDIIHQGHIDYLAKAADLGDVLIIGINSDNSVKKLNKGIARPLQDEKSRALIIASLKFVNAVIVFNDNTPFNLIDFLKPTILVKGADYDTNETNKENKKYIVGSDIVKASGGEVKTIEFLDGYSTTSIENKIKNSK